MEAVFASQEKCLELANGIYKISKILNVSPIFFFEGLEGIKIDNHIFPKDSRMLRVIHNISNLKNEKIKELLIDLILELGK